MLNLITPEYHKKLFGHAPKKRALPEEALADLTHFGLQDINDPSPTAELPLPNYGTADQVLTAATGKWVMLRKRLATFLSSAHTYETPHLEAAPSCGGWHSVSKAGVTPVKKPATGPVYAVDIETGIYQGMWVPICACVLTQEGWFLWVNPGCYNIEETEWLVPLTPDTDVSLGVAHNAGYERGFMSPQYSWTEPRGYWFCTMSLLTALRGMSNQQLVTYSVMKKSGASYLPQWVRMASKASLASGLEVVLGQTLEKTLRDEWLSNGMGFTLASPLNTQGQWLHWPRGQELAAMVESPKEVSDDEGSLSGNFFFDDAGHETPGYMTVACPNRWEFLTEVINYCFKDVTACVELAVALWPEFTKAPTHHIVSFAGMLLMSRERVPLSQEWANFFRAAESEYQDRLAKIREWLVGLAGQVVVDPENSKDFWYGQLDWTPRLVSDPTPKWYSAFMSNPTIKRTEVALLLRCTWNGKPLTLKKEGAKRSWVYLNDNLGTEFVPHPEDPEKPASNLISKDMFPVKEPNELSGELLGCAEWLPGLEEVIELAKSLVNWTSLRKRVASLQTYAVENCLINVPNDAAWGTWTKRKVGRFWPVCSNPKKTKVGSGAKSLICAPVIAGTQWKLVGADFDSQELRLASLIGDAVYGYVGSTPLSVSVIAGEKKAGTDTHSLVAKQAGCSRDTAKTLVYAILYGAGKTSVERTLAMATKLPPEETKRICQAIFASLKGGAGTTGLGKLSFQQLDYLSSVPRPVTPVLKDPLSLAGSLTQEFKPSKVNWLIQASGRNMLDLLVVFMDYLLDRLNVQALPVVSIHDQMYYMCPESEEVKVAYLLGVAHTYAWALAFEQMGLDTLPTAYLCPESIDVDYRVRKSVTADCVTPDQPNPMAPYGRSYSSTELSSINPFNW